MFQNVSIQMLPLHAGFEKSPALDMLHKDFLEFVDLNCHFAERSDP